MIVYVDTSALLKRVVVEPESAAVQALLRRMANVDDLLTSSALTWVEVQRALRRGGAAAPGRLAEEALSGIDELPLRPPILERARTIGPPMLRPLDAIHLASAVSVGASHLLTFDERLADAARDEDIELLAPSP